MMAKRGTPWHKVDVTRALQAVKASGMTVGRVEIEGAKIVIVSASDAETTANPLDEWMRQNAH